MNRKYLLIDGNNMAVTNAFANSELKTKDGIPSGVHFGTMQSLIYLVQVFGEFQPLVVWDGHSKRRIDESAEGVKQGLIPSGYKQNRKKGDELDQPMIDFYEQAPFLKKGIEQTGIPQIRLEDYETDDVIASYCKALRDETDIVCVTSDADYYQLLHSGVRIWNPRKEKLILKHEWEAETNLKPEQHVDCGALMGDAGDNIFGIPSWGEKTASKAIQTHGDWKTVLADLHSKFDGLRQQYPDLTGDALQALAQTKVNAKSQNFKYPGIGSMAEVPFSGVAQAWEDKTWKPDTKQSKGLKANLLALMFEKRVELAYSLKKMDDDIELPRIVKGEFCRERLLEYLDYYDIESLKDDVDVFYS